MFYVGVVLIAAGIFVGVSGLTYRGYSQSFEISFLMFIVVGLGVLLIGLSELLRLIMEEILAKRDTETIDS